MKKTAKRLVSLLLVFLLSFSFLFSAVAEDVDAKIEENAENVTLADGEKQEENQEETEEKEEEAAETGAPSFSVNLPCKSAILMEATTGSVLYSQNAEESLPPASVTKVMTLLLLMEAIDSGVLHWDDVVTVSTNAASMGGSQVYLKEGEQMKLEDLLKSVVIASANDAAVALAEHLCGSVEVFVGKMNERAKDLGMTGTVFENVTGLDDTAQNHLTSARDIALMSRELIKHKKILEYSSIWMDTIRDGAFGLTNTNRLVRFYRGCTGLKTGSTAKAGFCISVTAERDGLSLICVIMGAESRDVRNASAVSLLDWGFANYGVYSELAGETEPVTVKGSTKNACALRYEAFSVVLPKSEISSVKVEKEIPEEISAPLKCGDAVGKIRWTLNGELLGEISLTVAEDLPKIDFFEILKRTVAGFLLI